MSIKIQIKDLYEQTNTLINPLLEFKEQEWYQVIEQHADDFIQVNYPRYALGFNYQYSDVTKALNFVKKCITVTIRANAYTFSKLYETTVLEYNPLFNVDGTEVTERGYTSSNTNTQTIDTSNDTITKVVGHNTDLTTNNLTDNTNHTGTDTTDTSNTAETTSTLYLATEEQQKYNSSENATHTGTVNNSLDVQNDTTNNVTNTGTVKDDRSVNDRELIRLTRQGNIGVTKSTDLIDAQRVTVQFNYIEYVCHKLIEQFCDMSY